MEEAGHKVRLADIEDSERPGFIGEGTADILCYRIWIVWCLRRPFGKLSWNTMWWPYCRGHGGFLFSSVGLWDQEVPFAVTSKSFT